MGFSGCPLRFREGLQRDAPQYMQAEKHELAKLSQAVVNCAETIPWSCHFFGIQVQVHGVELRLMWAEGLRFRVPKQMGVSENRAPQYSTLNSVILIIRTPK